jgi:hypothetical protein
MTYNLVIEDPKMILFVSGELVAERLSSVSSAQANLEGHKLEDDGEMERVVTQWLITEEMGLCQQGIGDLSHDMINVSSVADTVWETSVMAVKLNMNFS